MFFDISAVVFMLILVLIMKKRGGVKALLSLSGLIISIFIAISVYPPVTEFVYDTPLPDMMEERISDTLSAQYENFDIEAIDAMPDFIGFAFQRYVDAEAQKTGDVIAQAVTRVSVDVIAFVLVVIVTKLIFIILEKILNIAVKLPVIKQFNSLLGAVCGFVMSIGIIWMASWILCVISSSNEIVSEFIQNSYTVELMSSIAPF